MDLEPSSPALPFQVAQTILDCAYAGLETDCTSPPDRSCVIVGSPAQDDCCDGQLTVGILRMAGSNAFPNESQDFQPCGAPIKLIYLDVSVFRCVPVIDENGVAPSCVVLSKSSEQIYFEAASVWKAVRCCLKTLAESYILDGIVLGQDIVDPEGGCGGSVLHIVVGVLDPCACP